MHREPKVGEVLLARYSLNLWHLVRVVEVVKANTDRILYANVRKQGTYESATGPRFYPTVSRHPNALRVVATLPGMGPVPTANVFADWLEEQGQAVAASMLRETFPMVGEDYEQP